jgi:hypothetical protein
MRWAVVALEQVVAVLEALGVRYYGGGAVADARHGLSSSPS